MGRDDRCPGLRLSALKISRLFSSMVVSSMATASESATPGPGSEYLDASSGAPVLGHATEFFGLAAPYLLVSADNDGSRCVHDGLHGSVCSQDAFFLAFAPSSAPFIPRS